MHRPHTPADFDVLVIGAGLSGIGAAWHVQDAFPGWRLAILEARDAMGGTWDLFRYPGIRSDSDMYTLGYRFQPWRDPEAIADGPAILRYIRETAREHGLLDHIRFRHRVVRAEWSSETARWTVEAEVPGENGGATSAAMSRRRFTCRFLYCCTGYYRYDEGYRPDWPGLDRFRGRVIHPQAWPEGLDYAGKRVVVIGSGATAVTLVPAMAEGPGAAGHVTMLQRSPTYIVSQPGRDGITNTLRRFLPERLSYALARWKNILRQMFFFNFSRRWPGAMKAIIRKSQAHELGDGVDLEAHLETHLAPRYDPWDERLCIAPDGDFFRTIREGRSSIVTGEIEAFTEDGVRLTSGKTLEADLVVTATGLRVEILSGVTLVVDGEPVDLSTTFTYKGMMYSDVPNLASTFGYTNASWTLKADLVAEHVCRILAHMDRHGFHRVTPRMHDPAVTPEPALDLTSGYVKRALPSLPSQGSRAPWKLHQNYVKDLLALRYGRVADPALEFASSSHGAERERVPEGRGAPRHMAGEGRE